MHGSCPPVGGLLEVVHETRTRVETGGIRKHGVQSPSIHVTKHSCSYRTLHNQNGQHKPNPF